ncbi:MAG: aldolase/citrate lyase family protein [Candidatus Heimdallarchaeota archaeon]|nr:aldolase/citrate lyase family protein [Candidatus Heimdallarchaeota archaeon]
MDENHLRVVLNSSKVLNAWLTIPSTWVAEIFVNSKFQAITIDMQHGLIGYSEARNMLQVISPKTVFPIVRVPWNEPGIIMKVLDAGAMAVICPMINNKEEAIQFVKSCKYSPVGSRSLGPIRSSVIYGTEYAKSANDYVLALVMIETKEGLENLDEILDVDGVDGVYVGTMDLSLSLGISDLGNIYDDTLNKALKTIISKVKNKKLIAGIHVNSSNVKTLIEIGYDIVTPINDTKVLIDGSNQIFNEITKIMNQEFNK